MPYGISRLGIVEIRSLDLDRDLDYYLTPSSVVLRKVPCCVEDAQASGSVGRVR